MRHTHLYDLMRRCSCEVFSLKHNASGLRRKNSGKCLKCGCLSGAIGTDQRNNLSLIYMKRNSLQSLDHTIVDLEVLYFQHCHCLVPPYSPRYAVITVGSFSTADVSPWIST